MSKLELSKYPRNIFIPVVLLIIGMLLIFILYKMHSLNVTEATPTEVAIKLPLNTKATFNIESNIIIGQKNNDVKELNLSGESILNIDLSNGEVVLEELKLKSPSKSISLEDSQFEKLKVTLNSSYPSTGKMDLKTGMMDISLDLLLKYVVNQKEAISYLKKTNMTISLSGNIDRKAGIIKLSGEATIPPADDSQPIPIKIQVVATTNPIGKEETRKNN